jgi:hypothetical protein
VTTKIAPGLFAALIGGIGMLATTSEPAHAIIYCTYVGYPVGCVARAGVVLRPRPVARQAATVGFRANQTTQQGQVYDPSAGSVGFKQSKKK